MSESQILTIYVKVEGFAGINTDIKPIALNINKDKTLLQLKEKIARKIKISPDDFIIFKENVSKALNDVKKTLQNLVITNGTTVRIQRGNTA